MDAEGNVIKKESYDEAVKNNTFALKTKRHLVKEGNYSLWDLEAGKKPETQKTWNPVEVTKETKLQIEYQMVITDNKLAGKEIKNVANAVSDEALKVTTDATVTPNGPSITPNKDSDKATYYLGEEAQYTITARQSRENVTAEKVIIKDQFDQKDNFLIKEGSFHVTFNGNDITKDVKITLNEAKDGFTMNTYAGRKKARDLSSNRTTIPSFRFHQSRQRQFFPFPITITLFISIRFQKQFLRPCVSDIWFFPKGLSSRSMTGSDFILALFRLLNSLFSPS